MNSLMGKLNSKQQEDETYGEGRITERSIDKNGHNKRGNYIETKCTQSFGDKKLGKSKNTQKCEKSKIELENTKLIMKQHGT